MRIWVLIFAAGALVTLCVAAGLAVGVLMGQRMTERAFCEPGGARLIPDAGVRAEVCP